MKKFINTSAQDKGKRLDIYLCEFFDGRLSRSQIKRLIENGLVLVDGQSRKVHFPLHDSHNIEVSFFQEEQGRIIPEDIPLDIRYEDDHIIVLDKAADMVVHPAAGNQEHTLVNALLYHTKGRLAHIDTSPRPGIVHRLDKGVSGLMVVAKNDAAYARLVESFKTRSIKRIYIAFVKGVVAQLEGSVGLPIGRAPRDRKKMAIRFFNSKEALTNYRVLKRFKAHTKVELSLQTGRTHQIRVHMSYIGHPVIGDTKYGGGDFVRIALYAAELIFEHPITKMPMHIKIDMPEELAAFDKGVYDI